MSKKTARVAAFDPLSQPCIACGARKGRGCEVVMKDGQSLPLTPRASRLVHAARLEGDPNA